MQDALPNICLLTSWKSCLIGICWPSDAVCLSALTNLKIERVFTNFINISSKSDFLQNKLVQLILPIRNTQMEWSISNFFIKTCSCHSFWLFFQVTKNATYPCFVQISCFLIHYTFLFPTPSLPAVFKVWIPTPDIRSPIKSITSSEDFSCLTCNMLANCEWLHYTNDSFSTCDPVQAEMPFCGSCIYPVFPLLYSCLSIFFLLDLCENSIRQSLREEEAHSVL